ncbi:MAG: ABC transporter ATP-binding protein [Sulfolobales archaeon]
MSVDVKLKSVSKVIKGRVILDKIDLEVPRGTIFCLVGPNGAGKTTTMRIIATLMRPSEGDVYIANQKIDYRNPSLLQRIRKILTYLPEEADTYSRLTGLEYLRFFADIHGVSEEDLRFGIEISGLSIEDLKRKTGTYSRGMRRRLLIARALMSRPQIAILDEPTSGLDVFSSVKVREVIKRFSREYNKTVILSTHNMLEAEDLCEIVALINKGRIVFSGEAVEALRKTGSSNLEEAFVKLCEER